MSISKRSSYICTVVGLLIVVASLSAEYLVPGVYLGIGYVIAVILTLFSENNKHTYLVAGSSLVAIIVAVLLFHSGDTLLFASANHAISLFSVLLATLFVQYVRGLKRAFEKGTKQINSLFYNATEGIITTNSKGEIVMANPFASQMFGYGQNELIGGTIESLIPQAARSRHVDHRQHFHEKPSNRSMGTGRDLYAMRKDGSVFLVEISLSHYSIDNEAFVTAFIIDITVRKQQDEALKKLNAELEEKVLERTLVLRETMAHLEQSRSDTLAALEKEKDLGDLKSRFVSTVSHEFRTPLSTILTSASLAKQYNEPDDAPKRERHLLRIENAVTHMNSMLEDLLSLGKLEEGLVEQDVEPLDLTQFFKEFIAEVNETNRNGQHIQYSENGNTHVVTDKRLLKNIMINLVSNAFKFSPPNATIDVMVNVDEHNFQISVKDAGIGISEEDLTHLFERFFRAQNASNIQGTGLGLHIVSKYLELMHGSINVESILNQGTTFTITIPNNL